MTGRHFFEGWYFKHQWPGGTLALIPAHHRSGGAHTASLQIITESGSDCLPIPLADFQVERDPLRVRAGGCTFGPEGCRLDCTFQGRPLRGELGYGPAAVPRGDIMGPFRLVPFLQCRHSVLSMAHTLSGRLTLGERRLDLTGGTGYIEGDRGVSFPERYLWTHCAFPGGSLMLSVADVPLWPGRITGCIAFVWRGGEELRLATYRGARVLRADGHGAAIRQGPWELTAELLEARPHPLAAPSRGDMTRTIHESAACAVRYRLTCNGSAVLEVTSPQAGFEAAWPET